MSMLDGMRPETKQALDDIGACFRGDDGGIAYLKFCRYLLATDKAAVSGNEDALRFMTIITYFHKLVKVVLKND